MERHLFTLGIHEDVDVGKQHRGQGNCDSLLGSSTNSRRARESSRFAPAWSPFPLNVGRRMGRCNLGTASDLEGMMICTCVPSGTCNSAGRTTEPFRTVPVMLTKWF